jgi:hypothetical protein
MRVRRASNGKDSGCFAKIRIVGHMLNTQVVLGAPKPGTSPPRFGSKIAIFFAEMCSHSAERMLLSIVAAFEFHYDIAKFLNKYSIRLGVQ